MFKIEYKTVYESCLASDAYYELYPDVDYFDAVDTVYGDILITVNNSRYGGISDISFKMDREDVYGDTVLDVWLGELLEACIALYSGTEYRVKEIECADVFLCLNKNGSWVSVTYLNGNKTEWTEIISYEDFYREVILTAQRFINDLCGYDERMEYSDVVLRIEDKLDKLEYELGDELKKEIY